MTQFCHCVGTPGAGFDELERQKLNNEKARGLRILIYLTGGGEKQITALHNVLKIPELMFHIQGTLLTPRSGF